VSAGSAGSTAAGRSPADPVRALQHVLYQEFHALRDKVFRRDVLWRAWVAVHRNGGAPGIDQTTLAAVQEYGVTPAVGRVGHRVGGGAVSAVADASGAVHSRYSGSYRAGRAAFT
jgi:RNA-directed DNA polymerase